MENQRSGDDMVIKFHSSSPLYEAYNSQRDIFDAAIDFAVDYSASKMTAEQINNLFSTKGEIKEVKAAA